MHYNKMPETCLLEAALEELQEKLNEGCRQMGIRISMVQQQQLLDHIALVAKWNRRLNLTAITDGGDMVVNHVLDSLSIIPYINGDRILDIGTGAGFPGVPLAIVDPTIELTLLDSRGKRIEFLRYACHSLKLDNISLQKSRVEDYRPQQKFDTLVARAFSSLARLVELTGRCRSQGVRLLALKGKYPDGEIAELSREVRTRVTIEKIDIPWMDAHRHIVIFEF